MLDKLTVGILALVSFAQPQTTSAQVLVEAKITADNAYRLAFGTAEGITTAFPAVENTTAGAIFNNPEDYFLENITASHWIYLAAWSDDSITQGLIGQFTAFGSPTSTYTGTVGWEVFATGVDFDVPSGGPTTGEIDAMIATANAAGGGPETSGTWVVGRGGQLGNLAAGEANDSAAGDFQLVTGGMDADARWMWFNRDPDTLNAFRDGNHKEYLIFRFPARLLSGVGVEAFGQTADGLGGATVALDAQNNLVVSGLASLDQGYASSFAPAIEWSYRLVDQVAAVGQRIVHVARGAVGGQPEEPQLSLELEVSGGGMKLSGYRGSPLDELCVHLNLAGSNVFQRCDIFFSSGPSRLDELCAIGGPAPRSPGDPIPDIDITVEQIPGGEISFAGSSRTGPGMLSGPTRPLAMWKLELDAPTQVTVDGVVTMADTVALQVDPRVPGQPVTSTGSIAVCSDFGSLTVDESASLHGVIRGFPHAAIGLAHLRKSQDGVAVNTNEDGLGEVLLSGDGLELFVGESSDVLFEIIEPFDEAGPASTITTSMLSEFSEELVVVGSLVHALFDNEYSIDFNPLGASQKLIELLQGSQVVHSETTASGVVTAPPGAGQAEVRIALSSTNLRGTSTEIEYELRFGALYSFSIDGGAGIMANTLRFTSIGSTMTIPALAGVEITGEAVSHFEVGSVETGEIFRDGFESGDTSAW